MSERTFRVAFEYEVKVTPIKWTQVGGDSLIKAAAAYAAVMAQAGDDYGEGWVHLNADNEPEAWDQPVWIDDTNISAMGWFKFEYRTEFMDDSVEEIDA